MRLHTSVIPVANQPCPYPLIAASGRSSFTPRTIPHLIISVDWFRLRGSRLEKKPILPPNYAEISENHVRRIMSNLTLLSSKGRNNPVPATLGGMVELTPI